MSARDGCVAGGCGVPSVSGPCVCGGGLLVRAGGVGGVCIGERISGPRAYSDQRVGCESGVLRVREGCCSVVSEVTYC